MKKKKKKFGVKGLGVNVSDLNWPTRKRTSLYALRLPASEFAA